MKNLQYLFVELEQCWPDGKRYIEAREAIIPANKQAYKRLYGHIREALRKDNERFIPQKRFYSFVTPPYITRARGTAPTSADI